jgi:hypothetical protein
MKIISAVVLTPLVLLPVGWQPGMTATNNPKRQRLSTAAATCGCRPLTAPHTRFWAAGRWRPTMVRVQRRSTSSMRHPVRPLRTGRTGVSHDGSVLVKEVHETTAGAMTTGTVSHAQALKGWFVLMKDSKIGHPGNKLWGNGWGWSWFDAANPSKTTSTDYNADCLPCHEPGASDRLDLCPRIPRAEAMTITLVRASLQVKPSG